MEHFVVSALKYRPRSFEDVVGQKAITKTLQNAITHNHLAQALLFCGPRGVGKTTCARILAKEINGQGADMMEEDFAFNIFELDAASNNSVDDIRNLIDQVRIPPQVGPYKVYIIDEVHMLSQAAFNAFLKTLEEPPKHAIFILATTEKHKIIPTILSRCQIFDFKRITVKDTKEYLAKIAKNQGIDAEDDALHIIAQKSEGAMRDALSIFDRVVSFSGKKLTRQAVTENLNVLDHETYFTATALILENNIPQLLLDFNYILGQGFDGQHFIAGLASHFRDLMVCKNEATIPLLEVGETTKQLYLEQSRKTSLNFLVKGIELANQCDLSYRASKNQRLLVELCLMQLASLTAEPEKKKPESSIIPPPAPTKMEVNPMPSTAVVTDNSQPEAIPASDPEDKRTENEVAKDHVKEPSETVPEDRGASAATPQPRTVSQKKKPAIDIAVDRKKVSGLSLASLKVKQDFNKKQQTQRPEEEELPQRSFNISEMQEAWKDYISVLNKKGEKILASILEVDTPKLKDGHILLLEFPNETMKVDLERSKRELLEFLGKKLNNYTLSLDITVNERTAKNYAYTPREKYEKLKEKNPAIEKLRNEFDLEID